jgi:hemerythrin-like metal-binding protein
MSFFVWETRYATGIQSIDDDHRRLVELIDQLYTAMSQGRAKDILQDIISGLIDYTKVHFKREEVFMKSVGFSDFDNHKSTHDAFIRKVKDFQQQLEQGKTNISIEVITFLRDWLLVHILNVDQKYISDFKKFGVK